MATLGAKNATTTTSTVTDFQVGTQILDFNVDVWEFPQSTEQIKAYKTVPAYKNSIDSLATFAVGIGWETEREEDRISLELVDGWGEDTFDNIIWNMQVMKKATGDSFSEIIAKDSKLINLKPISVERAKINLDEKGRIKNYGVLDRKGKWTILEKESMLHFSNNRVGDECHGTSTYEVCKWTIEALQEALSDEKMIKHRDLAMGVLEIDSDNKTKRDEIMDQYAEAVKNGEVLVLPKGMAELKPANNISTKDRLEWIRYLEDKLMRAVNTPEVILGGSSSATEVGGKMGWLSFEPTYVREQRQAEQDILAQLGIKIKFKRPASLGGTVQAEEQANTGQVAMQPNDVAATMTQE